MEAQMSVKVEQVKPGTVLKADAGFDCLSVDELVVVNEDNEGLWIRCDHGYHTLDGQIDTRLGVYVGLEFVR
jgi:hypothetical protein